MSTEADREKLRYGYELWAAADPAAVEYFLELLADDIDWKSLGEGRPGMEFSRSRSGKHEVLGYFQDIAAKWELVNYKVEEIVSEGERHIVICECAWKHGATGKVVETPKLDSYRMKDGLIVEFREYYDTAKTVEAAI
ncbi:MAG: nuclear transport factor 2 family protein [Verrucomicrobiota bacterium]